MNRQSILNTLIFGAFAASTFQAIFTEDKNGRHLFIASLIATLYGVAWLLSKIDKPEEKEIGKFDSQGNITLSAEDFDRLVEELENPRPPSPKILEAMKRFKELRKKNEQAD